MRVIKNINSANVCTLLGNKGADTFCAALDSLPKKDRKKSANYLVVPNIFVLSLSLSLSSRAGVTTFIFFHAYAREANRVQTSKQRTFRKFPLLFFVLASELSKEQNKETLTTDFTAKDNCNSLVIVCFLSLISRAGSSDMLSACRDGERTNKRTI